jgi:hypothetical protein
MGWSGAMFYSVIILFLYIGALFSFIVAIISGVVAIRKKRAYYIVEVVLQIGIIIYLVYFSQLHLSESSSDSEVALLVLIFFVLLLLSSIFLIIFWIIEGPKSPLAKK